MAERNLGHFLAKSPFIRELGLTTAQQSELARLVEEDYLVGFLTRLIGQIEDIIGIDPRLNERRILEVAAERIVRGLHAAAASIRLFDPGSWEMVAFGAYGISDFERMATIPVQGSLAGKVVQENRVIAVPSILKDPLYQGKEIVEKRGLHSLLAVPLRIPTFRKGEPETLGALQIYYKEEGREFDPLELIHAELLARRVTYVLAKKKILDLQELNYRKEKIADKIFVKLSRGEAIKLKDLFILLIPELGEFLKVKGCALFNVSKDQQFIHLDAAYPLEHTYHEPGYTFTVNHHPYFAAVVHGTAAYSDTPEERIDPNYLLIKDPVKSSLLTEGMRSFAQKSQIHSILLIPLRVENKVRHIMTFYAMDREQYFSAEEIEILIFFGKEIMKASRIEFLGDILHDFKNPAVAITGFARRARKLLDTQDLGSVRGKLVTYLDILVKETMRLQDLTLAMTMEGREEMLDLSEVARERFDMNKEVIRESRRSEIEIASPELAAGLYVYSQRFGLERVIDNLLHNATKAVPPEGGILAIRGFRDGLMACLEIRNTGEISADQIEQVRRGEVRGRGLNIIYRFIQVHHGKVEVRVESGQTVFTIMLPLQHPEGTSEGRGQNGR